MFPLAFLFDFIFILLALKHVISLSSSGEIGLEPTFQTGLGTGELLTLDMLHVVDFGCESEVVNY